MADVFDPRAVRRTYDAVAEEYAAKFGDDLEQLPFDRGLLDEVAVVPAGNGPVLDVGCGPGHVAEYLAKRGVPVVGLDLAPKALAIARRRNPAMSVAAADMRRLPLAARSCAGVVAFYSLHHLARVEVSAGLREFHRVLRPGGMILIATHEGQGELTSDADFLGYQVEVMGCTLFTGEELTAALTGAAFTVDDVRWRDPLPHEYQGPRVYVLAQA